jgi:hypothetical protein
MKGKRGQRTDSGKVARRRQRIFGRHFFDIESRDAAGGRADKRDRIQVPIRNPGRRERRHNVPTCDSPVFGSKARLLLETRIRIAATLPQMLIPLSNRQKAKRWWSLAGGGHDGSGLARQRGDRQGARRGKVKRILGFPDCLFVIESGNAASGRVYRGDEWKHRWVGKLVRKAIC